MRYPPFLRAAVSLLMAALLATSASAKGYPRLFRGVRPMGMGGAFTAVADDENALMYNPAGLARVERTRVGIFNPLLEMSDSSIGLLTDAADIDLDDSGEVSDLLRDYMGDPQHVRMMPGFPYVLFPVGEHAGMMVGGFAQVTVDADIRNPVWPETSVRANADLAGVAGGGLETGLEGLRAGLGAKVLVRQTLDKSYSAIEIADDGFSDQVDDDLKSGSGVAADLGLLYSLPFIEALKPQVGLAVLNVPEMGMGEAEGVPTVVNVGAALSHRFDHVQLLGALDLQDVLSGYDEDSDFGKRIHVGVEAQFPVIGLRAGLNQGYPALGATIDFRALRLDLAMYSEEVGTYAGQKDDQRYVAQISLGW